MRWKKIERIVARSAAPLAAIASLLRIVLDLAHLRGNR
jgi:hypothetical protein